MANIQKRTTKNGEVSYRVQIRIKGYPIQTATFKRLTDAKHWAQQTEADIRRGKYFKSSEAKKRTMAEAIDRYFKDVLSHRKNPVNQITYLKWWREQIGVYILADITPALIVEKRNELVGATNRFGRTVSKTTANRYTQALGHLYSVASKEWGWTSDNPVANISKFKEPKGRKRFLSEEERPALLAACKDSENRFLYTIVVLALSTGARKMEILNLEWKNVDFKRSVIVLHETKNGESRLLPLQGHARELLEKQYQNKILGCNYVFPSTKVKKDVNERLVYQPIDIRTAWENALLKAQIKDFRFHDLRHSAASYLAMNGATLAEIAEVLGHKTLQMVTVQQMRSLSLWQIKPDSEEKPYACQILEKSILIGIYDDYIHFISRLIQHFPARQTERDAVIMSDLAGDCIEDGISLCAFKCVCDEIRREGSTDDPFLPPSGVILNRAIEKTKLWQKRLDELLNPKPMTLNRPAAHKEKSTVPWVCKAWKDFDEQDKSALQKHLETLNPDKRKGYIKYLISMKNISPSFFDF